MKENNMKSTSSQVDTIVASQPLSDWESNQPQPLKRSLAVSQSYPLDSLGDILTPAAKSMCEVIQAPPALCGQSLLAAATLATQAHADVEIDGRRHPISENFLTIAESGERKTQLDKIALLEIRRRQEELSESYVKQEMNYKNQFDIYSARRANILKKNLKEPDSLQNLLEALGVPPARPLTPFMVIEEPTYEGLIKMLINGQPSLGLFSDEGGRMLGGHAMQEDNQMKTITGLCELWDGKTISRVRAEDGVTLLAGKRFSMHLMIQPVIANKILANPILSGQGFLSRSLICCPPSTIGQRIYKAASLTDDPSLTSFHQRIGGLLRRPSPLKNGKYNELNPRVLTLSLEAKKHWELFYNCVEHHLGPNGIYSEVRPFGAKAAEHAARISGMLTLLCDSEAEEVQEQEMVHAVNLVNYYLSEAVRLTGMANENEELVKAERLLEWFVKRGERFVPITMIYQYGPNCVRDKQIAKRLLSILEGHGWVRPNHEKSEGKKPKEIWEIHPSANIANPLFKKLAE